MTPDPIRRLSPLDRTRALNAAAVHLHWLLDRRHRRLQTARTLLRGDRLRAELAAATYDHVDPDLYEPDGGNTLDNVVTACRECNGRKGHRTPEEWGTPLRPPPPPMRGAGSSSGSGSGSGSDLVPPRAGTSSGSGSPTHDARLGSGQVGPDRELVPGRVGSGSAGSGPAGSGPAGSGPAGSGALGGPPGQAPTTTATSTTGGSP